MREIRMLRTMWRKLETGLRDGLRHRKMAKASGQLRLPVPVATAPAFDPTLGEGVTAMLPPYPTTYPLPLCFAWFDGLPNTQGNRILTMPAAGSLQAL